MCAYKKGILTREWLINSSREVFNEQGLNITLSKLAEELDITLGRLTHHFATKDLLFIAIATEYEKNLAELRVELRKSDINFKSLVRYSGLVMDLQYDYRCAQRYIATSSKKQIELSAFTTTNFKSNRESIIRLLKALINSGEIKPEILEEPVFRVFYFCYTCLFTSWPISLEIYDTEELYETMKPFYLKGIYSTFIPYCTVMGLESLQKLKVI